MVATAVMNIYTLGLLLEQRLPGLIGEPGMWHSLIDDMTLYVFADETHDRVRIMIPVAEIVPQDHDLMRVLLLANFDRALDARYAINDGLVFSMFPHQLSLLTEPILGNALETVIALARNTGSTFASSDLIFGGGV